MNFNIFQLLVSSLVLCLFLQKPVHAIKKSYIVYLGAHSHGPNPSDLELEAATNSHHELLGSHLRSLEKAKEAIFYSYNRHINGFAAMLEEEEAEEIAKNPKVVSVFSNKMNKLHTTRSWQFLGLEKDGIVPKDSIWEKASYGEDIIIGNLDSGVWPESKSFNDEGIGPIPSKWGGRGVCQLDNLDGSNKIPCNKKLIGAKILYKGYEADFGVTIEPSLQTARDKVGHGTHTLSTAGGNFVPGVSVSGNGNGTAKGGSPKARVAAYKVCWPEFGYECSSADILAGFEAAISDNVDVLSVSVSQPDPTALFEDPFAIGSFHALANGVVVVQSAGNVQTVGNDGPEDETVSSLSPWAITVAASTIDRSFTSYVVLGDKKYLKGSSLSSMSLPSENFYPLINAEDANLANTSATLARNCTAGALDPEKVKGKILVCLGEGTTSQALQASLAGAIGVVLANNEETGNILRAKPHVLPASQLNFTDGEYVYSYLRSAKKPVAYLTKAKTELGIKPSPIMAAYSSRGPNRFLPSILKPDITAPGSDIIAAYSEAISPTLQELDKRRFLYNVNSGTSMSCPHVAGIVGLLKNLHPDWSTAAIQSAIMTTATTIDDSGRPILDSYYQEATPFDYGAGHIQPDLAMDPGLVYDLNVTDHLNLLCASGYNQLALVLALSYDSLYTCPESYSLADFNYPSITVLDVEKNPVTVSRTVTNVGSPSTYKVTVKAPKGILVSVEPSSLSFEKVGEKKTFKVMLQRKSVTKHGGYVFGELLWSDGKHKVRSPLVIKPK
ncbi:hypothetical protein L6164_033270 [Bauhinia variegata]|uniref:Uncharacterized protein n=1 Tax=Bauhinia variegata TaxID=167791 RepID=A0ACB9KS31_BAUVA|nr:hypothetical protein L6164_033270 [Bauhinia variegata]